MGSDRRLIEWAVKSGFVKTKSDASKESMDKPLFAFGIPALEDLSCSRVIKTVAPLVPRNYVVAEVSANLNSEARLAALSRFSSSRFKRTAKVIMGTPDDDFREVQQAM